MLYSVIYEMEYDVQKGNFAVKAEGGSKALSLHCKDRELPEILMSSLTWAVEGQTVQPGELGQTDGRADTTKYIISRLHDALWLIIIAHRPG